MNPVEGKIRRRGNRVQVKPCILLVDDEADFLFSAGILLRKEGYRVSVAHSGEEACAMIVEAEGGPEPFRLLVTDMRMPGMSGLGLIDALRERNNFIPVLAITGFGDGKLYGELSARGCTDRIEKPFEPKDLLHRVRRMLEGFAIQEGTA